MYSARSIPLGLVFAVVLLGAACSDSPLGECPPNSENQQASGSMTMFFTCTGCHSETLTGPDRVGAPEGMDFDTPEQVRAYDEEIYESVVNGSMPPGGGLNDSQIEAVRVYLACGAP